MVSSPFRTMWSDPRTRQTSFIGLLPAIWSTEAGRGKGVGPRCRIAGHGDGCSERVAAAAAWSGAGVATAIELGWRVAALHLESADAQLEHARALTDLGAALRRANRRSEAREPLRRGADLAVRSGATVLARRAHTELAASGARPRRLVLSGTDSLTPSEHRVVQMAAQGISNREIAQALFVTAKTVETHLRHSYQKLGIRSRRELPR